MKSVSKVLKMLSARDPRKQKLLIGRCLHFIKLVCFRELLLGRIADCLLLRDEYKNEFRRVKEKAEEKGEKSFDFRWEFEERR